MVHTCDACQCVVSPDEGFFRSVNLRTVAWCRPCWLARHTHLGIPAQRRPPDQEPGQAPATERAERRWLLRG
jgi:hypothetical protein